MTVPVSVPAVEEAEAASQPNCKSQNKNRMVVAMSQAIAPSTKI